ncbi:hypothetical protein POVWA2_010750 [Plasmodium ovale wallikeri]|uniref:Uncharacterized protein n=1 Tax=Plasmodium ovale wallikeri TaxID=864142 RepID=A0A1A8YM64_PLAOA|nr:hypothetical protein POVWA2_010750 [Plasmodium ovale wallikeri]
MRIRSFAKSGSPQTILTAQRSRLHLALYSLTVQRSSSICPCTVSQYNGVVSIWPCTVSQYNGVAPFGLVQSHSTTESSPFGLCAVTPESNLHVHKRCPFFCATPLADTP